MDIRRNQIITHRQVCDLALGAHVTKGMNFRIRGIRTVVLMSQRANAPYRDQVDENGAAIWYEGHDVPKAPGLPYPKLVDQQLVTDRGTRTENGKFWDAAVAHRDEGAPAESVLAFDKIKKGLWSYAGVFRLVDAREVHDGTRRAFEYRLELDDSAAVPGTSELAWSPESVIDRVIPTDVKIAVWNRDGGRCTRCGAADDLHFDHVLPYAKGGSSRVVENIQLLCARHNLAKSDRIDG